MLYSLVLFPFVIETVGQEFSYQAEVMTEDEKWDETDRACSAKQVESEGFAVTSTGRLCAEGPRLKFSLFNRQAQI